MHHDGITGTSRSNVVSDYMSRLKNAASSARSVTSDMAELLLSRNVCAPKCIASDCFANFVVVVYAQATLKPAFIYPVAGLQLQLSEDAYMVEYPLVILNSLAWDRTELVRVVVKDSVTPLEAYLPLARVVDDSGEVVPSQLHAILPTGSLPFVSGFPLLNMLHS